MKFLFIVQGEGRGHLTQALTLEEHLLREGHEVVEVLVGKSRQVELVVLRKLLFELFGQLSNIRLTLLDLLFELRQLFSDRSCSHIITTILKF